MDLLTNSFALFLMLVLTCVNCEDNKYMKRDVIVVGGGLAGMAAARRLSKENNIAVKVLEARKERYGGRVWTHRGAAQHVRGVDVDIGAGLLNTKAKGNKLIDLAKEFELETASSGSLHIEFVDENGRKRVYFGDNATDLYTETFKIVIEALRKSRKANVDRPVLDVLLDALDLTYKTEKGHTYDQTTIEKIIRSFPAALLQNFSANLYNVENDFGWDKVVVDGMGELVDRIVAGSGNELPVKVDLNKAVRNIQIDSKRKKVIVRTMDRKQVVADAVIVALPIGVLKSDNVIFEPPLPQVKRNALQDIGIGYNTKIIVGFESAFWPKDVGTFNIFSELASNGFLQTWTNSYRLSGNPFLIGNILGAEAKLWETKTVELKELALLVLGELFGKETVRAHKLTTFVHSNWSTDEYVLGSVSYPSVGNTPDLWRTLQEPLCPHIYFAGAYTETMSHVDSLHGAYNSGVRAAEQFIKGVCKKSKQDNKKKTKVDKKKSKDKEKKDEL